MDFASIIVFLVLYYIRPQEWISSIEALRPVTLSMAFAIIAMFTRNRGLKAADFFKTPHDWLVLIYWIWMVVSAPAPVEVLKATYILPIFYFVTVQCLSNIQRIQKFLNWWTGLIFAIAALAVGSHLGFDPTGSAAWTERWYPDRVTLIMSLFNNPNSLGHSVIPVILMIYFVCVWKRPIFLKVAAFAIFAVPMYCVYLTKSKGSYLAAFVTAIAALTFGRPKAVQLLIVIGALTVGWAGLQTLPRMEGLSSTKSDEGMQGRVAAFKFGMELMKNYKRGVGYERFAPEFFRKHKYGKASHSSYVQVGSELGLTGLVLFLGILYVSARTLVTSRATELSEERVRRILFTMLVSYVVSSWMINITYRAAFFMMVAAIAALHRQMLLKNAPEKVATEDGEESEPELGTTVVVEPLQPAPMAPALSGRFAFAGGAPMAEPIGPETDADADEQLHDEPPDKVGIRWNRIGIIDIAAVLALTYVVVKIWAYAIEHF